jgi:YD repeat-containing protein
VPLPRSARRALAALLCLALALPTMPIVPIATASAASRPKAARSAVATRIVALARKELGKGVREIPDGSNRAPAIRRYETATRGAMFGAPWCAYFVSYIARRAGAPIGPGGAGMGYVPYIRAWAKQTRRWTRTPHAGDLVTFPQHVGIVENVYANHTLTTIEGNAGNAVRRRWRRWSEAMGYVRVARGPAAAPTPVSSPKAPAAPKPPKKGTPTRLVPRITAYPGLRVATGQTISFTSNDSTGDIVRSAWDLDGNGRYDASGDSVDKRYVKPGTYKISLRVTDRAKHTATTTAMVTVKSDHPPVAQLDVSATTLTVGDTLTGDASRSYDPEGRITRYEWDLNGDGNYSADGKKHSVTFDEPGDYNVGLRVTDDDGNQAETHVAIHVNDLPAPVARIACDATTIAAKKSLRCKADTSASPVKLTRLDWDTDGDGAYDRSGSEVRVTFAKAGARTLRLRVADGGGRVAESSVAIAVTNNLPTASLTAPSTVGLRARAAFDGLRSSDTDGVIASWEWDLDGDGTYENAGPQPSFVYTAPGTYTVRLRVTDDDGGQATTTATVRVTDAAPTARITLPAHAAVNADLTFDGTTSTDPDGTIAKYEWDLDGNGTYETTGANPVKRYTTTGTRTIRLRVTDDFGATATTSRSLTVTAT